VSPILVRPVREQLEHDRIIRLLPGKYKRKFEVGINPGAEQNAGIGAGVKATYPDAVLYSTERSRRVEGVVEVETGESINHLEAMAQWAAYGRLRVPFHLYVPIGAVDMVRRLALDHDVAVTEIWTYDNIGDQVRFTLVHKAPDPPRPTAATRPIATPRPVVTPPRPVAAPARATAKPPAPTPRPASATAAKSAPVNKKPVRAAAPRRAAPARPAPKVAAKRAKPAPSRKTAARKAPAAKRR
jgi:hypothetical protein